MLAQMPSSAESIVVTIDSIIASFFDLDVRRDEYVSRLQALTDLKEGRNSSKGFNPKDQTASPDAKAKRLKSSASATPSGIRSKSEEESKEAAPGSDAVVADESAVIQVPSTPVENIIDPDSVTVNDQVREVASIVRARVLEYHEALQHERDDREQAIKAAGKGYTIFIFVAFF